ncbi:MAG: hypothetical protein QM765_44750 [Myxococcales bacterium]
MSVAVTASSAPGVVQSAPEVEVAVNGWTRRMSVTRVSSGAAESVDPVRATTRPCSMPRPALSSKVPASVVCSGVTEMPKRSTGSNPGAETLTR